jgi:hypothetical protein
MLIRSLLLGGGLVLALAAPALACTEISSATLKLTGCVDVQWQKQESSGAIEFSYLTADQNFALQVITETAVLNAQQLHDAIIANAVAAVNNVKENVKEISARTENIDGKPFNLLEYTLTDGTTTIDYQNFYYSQPGYGTVQILVLSTPQDATAAGFKAGLFAGTVKVGG